MKTLVLTILLTAPAITVAQSSSSNENPQVASVEFARQDTGGTPAQQSTPASQRRNYFGSDMFFGKAAIGPHQSPAGSFTVGYTYVFTDSQTGHNRSLMGWYATPEVRLYRTVGLQAEFSGLYVRSVYPGENRFIAAAGPRYTFAPRSRFTPFVFAEGGEIRSTSQASRTSDWDPVVKGGIGFEHKAGGGIAFQLIPGEYIGEQLDDHSWEHSFSARAGITFNLYR